MKGVTSGEEQQHEHERDESVRDKREEDEMYGKLTDQNVVNFKRTMQKRVKALELVLRTKRCDRKWGTEMKRKERSC